MSRNVIFVLLLTAGVVFAYGAPESKKAPAGTDSQAQNQDAQGQEEGAKGQSDKPKERKETAQDEAGDTKGQSDKSTEQKDEANGKIDEVQAKWDQAMGETSGAEGKSQEGPKHVSGMSILGNQEAPKSLVIVPWKTSQMGAEVGVSTLLDDSKQPVDKDVFMRELIYYEIRSEKKP